MKYALSIFLLTIGFNSKSFNDTANNDAVATLNCFEAVDFERQWYGKYLLSSKDNSQVNISISKIDESTMRVSDFSCGFFRRDQENKTYEVSIKFDCLKIIPMAIETEYGPIKIIGGRWDSSATQLTIKWENDFNNIKEVSIIQYTEF